MEQATNYAIPEYGSSSRGHSKIPPRISTRTITEQRAVNRRKYCLFFLKDFVSMPLLSVTHFFIHRIIETKH